MPNPGFKLIAIEKSDKKYSVSFIKPKSVIKFVSYVLIIILQLQKPKKFPLILAQKRIENYLLTTNVSFCRNIDGILITDVLSLKAGLNCTLGQDTRHVKRKHF